MRKIFTFLLALAASVGLMNAKVTWNSSNISDLSVYGTEGSYSKEGVTLSTNGDMIDARWFGYGDESKNGISFNANQTGGFTFSNTLGKNFTKIEMTLVGPGDWDRANLGSGWSFFWDPGEGSPVFFVTWKGNASTVDLLKEASDFHGDYVKSIVFYFEGDSEAPDPTYTVALKDGTANADKVTLSATSAVEGATVTVTPDEEYEIKDFSATYNTTEKLSTSFDPATGAYSFAMPAANVTIEATIALKPVPEGDVFAGFTATAGSGGFDNEGHANLVDGKFTSAEWTKWCANNDHRSVPTGESGDACWWIDFEASAALNLTGYILTTGNDTGNEHGRNPKNWVLKAKLNAGDAWTTIATVTDDVTMKNKSFKDYKFFVDQSGPYQYFRFEVFANQGAGVMQLCELRLIGTEAPAPATASPVTAARFLYNYDCQRNPAYPKQGTPCTLRGFSNPYVGYNGIGSDAKNTPFGPWKLEFVANYTPSNDYGCQRVVSQAVNQYYSSLSNQEKEAKRLEVPIFRLWQYNIVAGEYQHASYGIVCAYADEGNAEDHGALFISSEGNGCFLAGKPHDAQISLSCENDLTTGMNNLITAASATDPDYDAYMPVILSIDAIGTVELTQHCKDFIEGSSSAYNALTDAQKEQVTNYQVLEDAKNQWAPLVAEAKPYADAVVDLINAIPNPIVYTQSCKDKIDAAQKAYDALTSGQKIFVSNYETLKNAPFDLIKAAPYAHILFKANGKEKKVENVTLPKEFTEAEMKTMLKEMYSVEGDYDMYANSYSDAVNISGGKWTIYPFMGTVNINGDLNKFDQEGHDMIPISLEITLELPPYEPEPLADCELAWKDVPEGGVVGTIGHEDEVKLPYFTASLDFMLALDKGTATFRLGSTDESVLAVYGINDFAVKGVGECDVYIVHDEDAVFAYDSAAFHVTVNPEPTPVGNLKLIEFQVPASWENDNTPISIADFPDFVATTYEIASALPVTFEPSLVVFGFSGDDETSVYTKMDGQVSKPSTGTIVRKTFFENTQAHYYYPVLAGEPEPTVYNSGSVALSNLKVGDILMAGVTLTDDSNSKVKFVPSRLKLMGNIRKSEFTVANFVSSLQTPLLGENAAMTFQGGVITITPIDEEGKDGNAWVVTEIYVEADIPVTLAGITYSGTEPQPTPTTTVTWNSTDFTEEGTYTSHKGIEVNPGVEVIDIAMEVPIVTISPYGPGSFSATNSNLVFTKIEVSGGEYDEPSFAGEGWSDSEGKRVWEGQAATVPFNLGFISTGDEGNIPWTIVFTLAPAAPQPQPTAVENVQTNQVQGTKILRDGQLYIMYNGTMYNVQGARVK